MRLLPLLLCCAALYAYQWPVGTAVPATTFLQGDSQTGEISLGVTFVNPGEMLAFAKAEVVYRQQGDHPLALPADRELLVVLQHQDWLISYFSAGMQRTGRGGSASLPEVVEEGEQLAIRPVGGQSSRVQVEFYDFKNDVVVSPWLMLPEREPVPNYGLLVESALRSLRAGLRPQNYLYPESYSLLFEGPRIPVRVQVLYGGQQLVSLDFSTVEQRGGVLYTNSGLTRIDSLQSMKNLEIATLQVTGAVRQWQNLQVDAYFNDLRAITKEYSIFVLPASAVLPAMAPARVGAAATTPVQIDAATVPIRVAPTPARTAPATAPVRVEPATAPARVAPATAAPSSPSPAPPAPVPPPMPAANSTP